MVESNKGPADYSNKINSAQSHINSILYGVAKIGGQKVPEIQNSSVIEEYLNFSKGFQIPKDTDFSKLMQRQIEIIAKLDWMEKIISNECVPMLVNQ